MKRKSKTFIEAQKAVNELCVKILALPAPKQEKVLRFMEKFAVGLEDRDLKKFWNGIYEYLKTSIETEAKTDEK